MKGKKVYLVTWGEYSDFSPVCVFTEKHQARRYCKGREIMGQSYEFQEIVIDPEEWE